MQSLAMVVRLGLAGAFVVSGLADTGAWQMIAGIGEQTVWSVTITPIEITAEGHK